MDEDLRELERARTANPGDGAAEVRHRLALVRTGRAAEAGLQLGDVVSVTEKSGTPWIEGTWTGRLVKQFKGGDRLAIPIGEVRWTKEPREGAVYLTANDTVELAQPEDPAHAAVVLKELEEARQKRLAKTS